MDRMNKIVSMEKQYFPKTREAGIPTLEDENLYGSINDENYPIKGEQIDIKPEIKIVYRKKMGNM